VSGFRNRRDDGASEVSPGAGDEDLHDGFIPVTMACFLRQIAFRTDGCFVQCVMSKSRFAIVVCFAALIFWMPIQHAHAAQDSKKVAHTTIRNLAYRENPENDKGIDTRCRVDIHHPKTKGFATVVWFHGGGLTGGSRGIPDGLKDKGIAIVAAGYRLNPDVKSPTYIEDAAAAVAWTVKNIGKYGGDPNKIFVSGHSAGGYLSAMIGLDKRWLAPHGIDPDTLAGLIPLSPQAITHYTIRKERGIADTKVVVDDLAPINHVRPDAPPILLVTGDRELELLGRYEENAYFWRMFKVVGHKDVQLKELQGFNHGNMGDAALPLVVEFVRKRVGGAK
jgi:acetyl esterase/lipase